MHEIFDNAYKNVKNIQIDGMLVTWSVEGGNGPSAVRDFPLLLMGVTIQYGRQAVPYNTINVGTSGDTLVQIMGRPQGTMSVNTIIGAASADTTGTGLVDLIKAAGATCGKGVTLYMQPANMGNSECTVQGMKYVIKNAFLTSYSNQTSSGNGMINIADSLVFNFTSLQIEQAA